MQAVETKQIGSIENICVTTSVFDQDTSETALQRFLDYQAYVQMKEWLSHVGELPDELLSESLPIDDVARWIMSGDAELSFSFRRKIEDTLLELKARGSDALDELCELYCAKKKEIALTSDGSSIGISIDFIKEIILDSAFDVLFVGGVPLTVLISFLIRTGVLDRLCDCDKRGVEQNDTA